MITSAKNYIKKKKQNQKTDRQNPRTNGKSKAIQTSHRKKHKHTHSQKEEKENIYIYLCCEAVVYIFYFIINF